MKKLLSLMLLLMAAVMTTVTFTSCGDDDDDNNDKPQVQAVSGTYTGKDTLAFSVMGMTLKQTNTTDVSYVVSQNKDGSINVVIPEETFDFTAQKMGNIVQGAFSVANIPYNEEKKAYYLDYSGLTSADVDVYGAKKNYTVTKGEMTVTFSGNKVTIVNEHKFGNMPMTMTGIFAGTRK